MTRALLGLALAVVVLALVDRWLGGREERAHTAGGRVGALFAPEEAQRLRKQPALRIELSGESHSYGRIEGQWRCLSYHQAPADGRAIQALIDGIAQAEGLVHSSASEEAPSFGINTPRTLRVSLQGPRAMQDPGGDVQLTLEIGLASGREGCFVRKKGTREVWSIASDLRAPLEERLGPGLPPLLAAGAVPEAWLERGDLLGITLERGGRRTLLERRERELDPAAMKPGDLPWSWVLVPSEGAPEDAGTPQTVPESFARFLEHLPYRAVLDADRREARVPTPPRARLTLRQRGGAQLVLDFGGEQADGVPLWVAETGMLFLVEPRTYALAVPDENTLTVAPGATDPWSAAASPAEPGSER